MQDTALVLHKESIFCMVLREVEDGFKIFVFPVTIYKFAFIESYP